MKKYIVKQRFDPKIQKNARFRGDLMEGGSKRIKFSASLQQV